MQGFQSSERDLPGWALGDSVGGLPRDARPRVYPDSGLAGTQRGPASRPEFGKGLTGEDLGLAGTHWGPASRPESLPYVIRKGERGDCYVPVSRAKFQEPSPGDMTGIERSQQKAYEDLPSSQTGTYSPWSHVPRWQGTMNPYQKGEWNEALDPMVSGPLQPYGFEEDRYVLDQKKLRESILNEQLSDMTPIRLMPDGVPRSSHPNLDGNLQYGHPSIAVENPGRKMVQGGQGLSDSAPELALGRSPIARQQYHSLPISGSGGVCSSHSW